MIEAVDRGPTSNKARVICDVCAADQVFTSDYQRTAGNRWHVNEGQVIRKAQGKGWEYVKSQMLCPKCSEERRMKPEPKEQPAPVTPIREATREQKREIVEMLKVAYDLDAGRYVGGNTDHTIAAELGGGIMPGWVAEIREGMFGPDGGNDDIETVIADLAKWQAEMEAASKAMHDLLAKATADLRAFNEGRGKAAEFHTRIEAIKKAVGPKARSA